MQLHVILCFIWVSSITYYQIKAYRFTISHDVDRGLPEFESRTPTRFIVPREIRESRYNEDEVELDENGSPRDKRTLGFLVQGLAGAFGYTFTPLQVQRLSNDLQKAQTSPQPPATVRPTTAPVTATPAPAPATTPAPVPPQRQTRKNSGATAMSNQQQRETIRITGVLNFGNNAQQEIPRQLRQFEQLFHGPNVGAVAPPVSAPLPVPAEPAKPAIDTTTILVNTSPPTNINVAVPPVVVSKTTKTVISPTKKEIEYRKNENVVKYDVKSKEIRDPKEVYLPASKYTHDLYVGEPNWKKNYDERLRNLEEMQKDYLGRLKQQENRNKPGEHEDYEVLNERFHNREKEIADRDRSYAEQLKQQNKERNDYVQSANDRPEGKEKIQEENEATNDEESSERYNENIEELNPYNELHKRGNHEESPHEYRYRDDEPQENYKNLDESQLRYSNNEDDPRTYLSFGENILPISQNNQKPTSKIIKNSYGENLVARNQGGKTGQKEANPWLKESGDKYNADLDALRREYSSPPPESKYEEYELREIHPQTNLEKPRKLSGSNENGKTTSPSYSAHRMPDYSVAFRSYEPYLKKLEPQDSKDLLSTPAVANDNSQHQSEDQPNEESNSEEKITSKKSTYSHPLPLYKFDFKNFNPFSVPRKIYYSEKEFDAIAVVTPTSDKSSDKLEDPKQPEENLEKSQPTIGLPTKATLTNLHENEEYKKIQAWPAPFDYVFDSTEQTRIEIPAGDTERSQEKLDTVDRPRPMTSDCGDPEEQQIPTPYQEDEDPPQRYQGYSEDSQNVQGHPEETQAPQEDQRNHESNKDDAEENEEYKNHSARVQDQSPEGQRDKGHDGEFQEYQDYPVSYEQYHDYPAENQGYDYPAIHQKYQNHIKDDEFHNNPNAQRRPVEFEEYQLENSRFQTPDEEDESKERYVPKTDFLENLRKGSRFYTNHQIDDTTDQPKSGRQQNCEDNENQRDKSPVEDEYQTDEQYFFQPQSYRNEEYEGSPLQDYSTKHKQIPHEEDHQSQVRSQEAQPQNSPRGSQEEFNPSKNEIFVPEIRQFYTLASPQVEGRRFDENVETSKEIENNRNATAHLQTQESPKKFEDPKSAHDFFGFSNDDYNVEDDNKESEKNVENCTIVNGNENVEHPTIPEPSPYYYDEKLTEFTDQPESDTEKVKVKEYRNKVGTLTVSEKKRFSLDGPVHLVGYTRNF